MQVIAPERKGISRTVAIGALFVAISFICGYALAGGRDATVSRGGMASLMVDYGDGTIDTYQRIEIASHETLFDLTRRVAQENNITFSYKEYADLGPFVSQIGPAREVPQDVYWQYWVNNAYGQVGADSYEVAPGDVIAWKLTKGKQ
jgi:Domain of unknown function (DUF4430)